MGTIAALGDGDTSELVELYKPLGLYLKPAARVNISVTLPQLRDPSQSISNWDFMERIKKTVHPQQFASIRVSKSTMEFVRFEAECVNREQLAKIVKSLDNSQLKVIGFYEALKVKAGEAKSEFPTRHDWDTFFREADNMNELRAGERPDTIYFAQLPVRWFQMANAKGVKVEPGTSSATQPSEIAIRRVFETFGEVRAVDIPICDPFRKQMSKTGMRTTGFSHGPEVCFEAYVQFVEYISFVKAMDTLRGMKLVLVKEAKASAAAVKVDFDRTKHMSDKSNRRRRMEREKLAELERIHLAKEAEQRAKLEAERAKLDDAAFQRRRAREEKRRVKALEKKRLQEEREITRKIAMEERKLLAAERKLSSIRLLTELFKRVERAQKSEAVLSLESDLEAIIRAEREEKERSRAEEVQRRQRLLQRREETLKTRMTTSAKAASPITLERKVRMDAGEVWGSGTVGEVEEVSADSSFEGPPIRSQVACVSSSRELPARRVRVPERKRPLSPERKRLRSESPQLLATMPPRYPKRAVRLPPPAQPRPKYETYYPPPKDGEERRSVIPGPKPRPFQPRRVQAPLSPPVREGGGDPFELLLDCD